MMHYSERDDKPGRKMFSWALSDQGDIWEELLTDNAGQYVELQSGRLFNQNMVTSVLTLTNRPVSPLMEPICGRNTGSRITGRKGRPT